MAKRPNIFKTYHALTILLLFKVLRRYKKLYDITLNELLLIVTAYYYIHEHKHSFTKKSIQRFQGYMSENKVRYFSQRLIDKGFFVYDAPGSDTYKNLTYVHSRYIYYTITDKVYSLIQQYSQFYTLEIQKFRDDGHKVWKY